jgi:hypothetical protein
MLALKRFLGEKVIILCKGVQVEIMLVDCAWKRCDSRI